MMRRSEQQLDFLSSCLPPLRVAKSNPGFEAASTATTMALRKKMNVKCFTLRRNIAVWLNGNFVTLFIVWRDEYARPVFLSFLTGRGLQEGGA
jgi:hypothetical protein